MRLCKRFRRFGVALACIGVVSAIAAVGNGSGLTARAVAQEASFVGTPGHLYVDDYFSNAVYRFRLRDGLPDANPDSVVTGFNHPDGIGMGPAGRLYVADTLNSRVAVFGPDATGPAKPLWTLHTLQKPTQVAIDEHGLMYVGIVNQYVLIYAPGSHGHAAPIGKIVPPYGVAALIYDKKDLYVLDYGRHVYIPTRPGNWLIYPERPSSHFYEALTVADNKIYVLTDHLRKHFGADYSVVSTEAQGAIKQDETIFTNVCGQGVIASYGVAVWRDLLYQTCDVYYPFLNVFRAKPGLQKPLRVLRGPFKAVGNVVLGP